MDEELGHMWKKVVVPFFLQGLSKTTNNLNLNNQ